ncbi:MAG: class II fumarate hydratase [Bacteroidales bacterium]|nr:class II fumarate hydratase [Bacteroidales bacterium]
MEYRIEHDSLGEVKVPAEHLWGAQTERARHHFAIGDVRMPMEIINGIVRVKMAAAQANSDCGVLAPEKCGLIRQCCEEILEGRWDDEFPLPVWQTGSGTQTNMNVNEVISNRAEMLRYGKIDGLKRFVHPNDDVNKSQSTNDVFPTALRVSAALMVKEMLLPALWRLRGALAEKSAEFADVVKIGRTHLMDATPLTLGQEFSGYVSQVEHCVESLNAVLPHLLELPIGGTAVGTGLNVPEGYVEKVVEYINLYTGLTCVAAPNRFEAMMSHDSLVELSGALRRAAVSLTKIANDFRLLGSGPRAGLGDLVLPSNEPGSSIMPGKVNPTQCEALEMVCCQVIGNDAAIAAGGMQGHLELNVNMPLIGRNLMESMRLLSDATHSFSEHCVRGVQPNRERIRENLDRSLMLVTALNTHIGYDNAAKIAQYAHAEGITLKEAAIALQLVTAEEFDQWVVPARMCGKQ